MSESFENIDPNKISALEELRQAVRTLLNLVEQQASQLEALKVENQELKDENNRLKGEQGKPKFKPKAEAKDYSSGSKEKKKKNHKKGSKKSTLEIEGGGRSM